MAVDTRKLKLRRTTILYWSLLVYILAALLWWLISLENQNQRIRAEQLQLLELQASQLDPLEKERRVVAIESLASRNSTKYISEGITFLIVILIGAVGLFRAVRRQLRAQQQQQQYLQSANNILSTYLNNRSATLNKNQQLPSGPGAQQSPTISPM